MTPGTLACVVAILLALVGCRGSDSAPPTDATVPLDPAVVEAVELLRAKDARVRVDGAYRIARIGPPAAGAVPALIGALADPDADVRRVVVLALIQIGEQAQAAIPHLSLLAADPDPRLKELAPYASHRILSRQRVRQAIPQLEASDARVRYQAATALRAEAPDIVDAVPALLKAVKSRDPTVRRIAVQTLGRAYLLEPPINILMAAAEDDEETVRDAALQALGHLSRIFEGWEGFAQGDRKKGLAQLLTLAREDSLDAVAWNRLGWAYLSLGGFEQSVEAFSRVLSLVPGDPDSYLGRGSASHGAGQLRDALFDLDRALYLDAQLKRGYVGRAFLHQSEGRYELAAEDCRRALELPADPRDDSDSHAILAFVYIKSGMHRDAVIESARALETDAGNAGAYYYKALAHEALGQTREASEAYKQFVALEPPAALRDAWDRVRAQMSRQ